MPLLGALLVSLFGSAASFFVTTLGRKLAVATAAVAVFATASTTLLVVWNTAMVGLVGSFFNTSYGQFVGLFFPPAAGNCIATYAGVWAACALYKWQTKATLIAVQS